MARGLIFDMLYNQRDIASVHVVDRDAAALVHLAKHFTDGRVTFAQLDVADDEIGKLLAEHDGAIGAAHYDINLRMTRLAIENGCNYVDLGGNNAIVSEQLDLDASAQASGVSVVPDGGLAPGMVSGLVACGGAASALGRCRTHQGWRSAT